MENNKRGFLPDTWLWVITTAVLCAIFTFALIPGASAQGRISNLTGLSNQSQIQRYQSSIQTVFDFILNNYVEEVDPRVIFEGAMTGMFNALDDPYSVFMSESDMSGMRDTTHGSFGGVGLNITKPVGATRPDGRPAWVEVVSPIEGTPGWRAGINPGDFIIEINGIATETITMDEVLGMLRGTPGETVNVVIRRGERMTFPLTITRAVIEVPTVRYAMIGNIGYLRVLSFTPMTAGRAKDAINEFAQKNYTGIILDLRNNYGGLLNSAVDVASLFLDGGLVVRTKSRIASENRNFNTNRRFSLAVPAEIPIIVLINRGSASGAEIVAGALKDRGRAYLVGENTFGKGSVQQVFPLDGDGFRITTARYFTPSDADIDKVGIPPDREVKFPEYTEEDSINLNELINANRIPEFVRNNPEASRAQIDAFAAALEKEFNLDAALLRRLIRNELNRTTIAPVFDLEYDIQLQEAVNILQSGIFPSLMRDFRTLKAIQDETEEQVLLPIAS